MLRMLRSAVFIVPMNSRLLGKSKSAGVLQVDGLVAIFQQIHQLAEDSWEIGPIHLIDDQNIWPVVGVHGCRLLTSRPLVELRMSALRARTRDEGPRRTLHSRSSDGTGRCASDSGRRPSGSARALAPPVSCRFPEVPPGQFGDPCRQAPPRSPQDRHLSTMSPDEGLPTRVLEFPPSSRWLWS